MIIELPKYEECNEILIVRTFWICKFFHDYEISVLTFWDVKNFEDYLVLYIRKGKTDQYTQARQRGFDS